MGTCWWGADSNLALFRDRGVTDGSSNTALFSEKLLGSAAADPPPTATGAKARRQLFVDVPGMDPRTTPAM